MMQGGKTGLSEVAGDEQLAQAMAQNNLGAFRDLLQRWQERLRRYFWRMTGDARAADQLWEKAMLSLFERRQTWDWSRGFAAQALNLASLLCHEWLESRPAPAARAWEAGPEGLDLESQRERLQSALLVLPPVQREILLLLLLEGLPLGLVSEALGLDEEALKMQLWKAYRRFKPHLGDPFGLKP